jgi:Domain of unknown function (DUF4177)
MQKLHAVGAITVLLVILSIAWQSRGPVAAQEKPAPASQKWEYKVETVPALALDQQQKRLNQLGSDGWELCATERNGEREGVTFIIFKRPKR